ncbi:polyribonucleotide nucleotidyltransferase, partial [Candidatus Microgenomates bacterium]|nr:polyribonucleotide nucleotidyltransferase [Candidatus Microgenomates bacterium]
MSKISHEVEVGKRTLTLETGEVAGFATSSVMARYGDTMVLATVVSKPLVIDPGYMPLTVDYIERLYAGGRIKGSQWVKRDGRPSDEQILSARLIDRSLRPLFPKSFRDEIQVIATVVSVDGQNDPSVLAGVAASAALATSGLPWDGPVGIVRVGLVDDTPVINPLESEMKFSDLDLVVTGHNDAILMLEAGVNKINEEKLISAISAAQAEIKVLEEGISAFAKKVGRGTIPYVTAKDIDAAAIDKAHGGEIGEWAVKRSTGAVGEDDAAGIKAAIKDEFELTDQQAGGIFEELVRKRLRAKLLTGKRPDGRKPDEIRQITIQAGVLPRTHGSA